MSILCPIRVSSRDRHANNTWLLIIFTLAFCGVTTTVRSVATPSFPFSEVLLEQASVDLPSPPACSFAPWSDWRDDPSRPQIRTRSRITFPDPCVCVDGQAEVKCPIEESSYQEPPLPVGSWHCFNSPQQTGKDCSDDDPMSTYLNKQIQPGGPGILGRVPDEHYFPVKFFSRPASYISAETYCPHAFFHEPIHLRFDKDGNPQEVRSYQVCPIVNHSTDIPCAPPGSGMNPPPGKLGLGQDYPMVLNIIASAFVNKDPNATPSAAFPHDANSDSREPRLGRGCKEGQTVERCGGIADEETGCKCSKRLWKEYGFGWVREYFSTNRTLVDAEGKVRYKPAFCQCWFDPNEQGGLSAMTAVQNQWWWGRSFLADTDRHLGVTRKGVKWLDTWNEVVMPAEAALGASFWDAIAIKLPAATESLSDLLEDAQVRRK
uniref:Uncharacterized protein n=1 Tax=Chromera velia CCMP2878 TaxID=1169474 RepID=A0A0K6S6K7_9ALVE|eukprot:Cvel_16273.t1-p1 / transcript=Cvel_16273.t1 / gene=Cvel_16273 / organism=Chromera_velia_CCMP2878 / gene_product=hypothetical protein / transcript_product=hypothetical protein / location=Cvel_scaffold1245:47831-49827(+) / protein_length=432 / sequence_SO=supercontig / SO=protein_coding / is_pseudo=false